MNVQADPHGASQPAIARHPIAIDELAIRHLRTHWEIERILHLRNAIDLSVHAAGGAEFAEREKKETNAALSARSSCVGKRSARSGSCPWTVD